MNVYIVGAGAIGTWIGDVLRKVNCNVIYAPRQLADVQPVQAELAIVAVKAFDTPGALETLKRGLASPSETVILCLQNGIGNEEELARVFGVDQVIAGVVTMPIERYADGTVFAVNRGGIGLAPLGKQPHNWCIAMLGQTQLSMLVASDYRALKWSKLALNAIANAACAILDYEPQKLIANNDLFALELAALRETAAVMKKAEIPVIDLPGYPVRALVFAAGLPTVAARMLLASRMTRARAGKLPSLLLDLRAGKTRSEVGVLNGAIAALADTLGVAAPVHRALTETLTKIAETPSLWQRYRGRPDALLADIHS